MNSENLEKHYVDVLHSHDKYPQTAEGFFQWVTDLFDAESKLPEDSPVRDSRLLKPS